MICRKKTRSLGAAAFSFEKSSAAGAAFLSQTLFPALAEIFEHLCKLGNIFFGRALYGGLTVHTLSGRLLKLLTGIHFILCRLLRVLRLNILLLLILLLLILGLRVLRLNVLLPRRRRRRLLNGPLGLLAAVRFAYGEPGTAVCGLGVVGTVG